MTVLNKRTLEMSLARIWRFSTFTHIFSNSVLPMNFVFIMYFVLYQKMERSGIDMMIFVFVMTKKNDFDATSNIRHS